MNWLQNELYKINENIIQKNENNNFLFKTQPWICYLIYTVWTHVITTGFKKTK